MAVGSGLELAGRAVVDRREPGRVPLVAAGPVHPPSAPAKFRPVPWRPAHRTGVPSLQRGKFFRKPASSDGPRDTHLLMGAPPADSHDDRGPLPGLEHDYDCWAHVFADLKRAVAPIRRDARRMRLPASEIDDAVQDALCQAWLKRDELDRTRPLIPWLRGFGRRAIAARLLARSFLDDDGNNAQDPEAILDHRERRPEELVAAKETGEKLRALLRSASSRYREVLVARYWEGVPVSVIADRLGQSPKAVQMCLGRALAWLDEMWRGGRWSADARGPARKTQESAGQNPPPFG